MYSNISSYGIRVRMAYVNFVATDTKKTDKEREYVLLKLKDG
jgi:hypothetical protein